MTASHDTHQHDHKLICSVFYTSNHNILTQQAAHQLPRLSSDQKWQRAVSKCYMHHEV